MNAQFILAPQASEEAIAQLSHLHPAVVHVLHQRGLTTPEKINSFLHPDYHADQHDPFLFQGMHTVVKRIMQAKESGEQVTIYGDYDADGVCSTALLHDALTQVGITNLNMYLPHRDTEGYGLNTKAVGLLNDQGTKLLITVDCGVSNKEEVALAVELGMDVIITDHHEEPPQLPEKALAVINPKIDSDGYPFRDLAGVGVAFKVAQALGKHLELGEAYEKWLLDLVAVSTVTDCMPLLGENRTLMRYGLIVLNKTRRVGLRSLIAATHKPDTPIDATTIGFRIGPWINAAGRMGHANVAAELLMETDPAKAEQYVVELKDTNDERRRQTESMFKEAKAQVEDDNEHPIVQVFADNWPLGLVGLVAGKLVSAFHKPAFVMTSNNGEISGSGRSVDGLNMMEVLQSLDHLFLKYGGHAMACGFTLEATVTPEQFLEEFSAAAEDIIATLNPVKEYTLACELQLADINWDLVNQLELLQPFGQENPEPMFIINNVQLTDFAAVGKTSNHLRLTIGDGGSAQVKAIGFGFGEMAEQLEVGQSISVAATIGINHWNGNSTIQLQIKHIEPN